MGGDWKKREKRWREPAWPAVTAHGREDVLRGRTHTGLGGM